MSRPEQIHLVLGGSAGGCLRAAVSTFGLTGRVHVFSDDLSHGPLDDKQARTEYFKALFQNFGQLPDDPVPSMADFDGFSDRMAQDITPDICIWAGDNASEQTFLKMACHSLRFFKGAVMRVGASGLKSPPYIGPQTPALLARLFDRREALDMATRASLSADYLHLRDSGATLRKWEAGRIVDVSEGHYDSLLLGCCTADWICAARVVGTAMGRGDEHNLLSDVFLAGRLQYLIGKELIEASGPPLSLRGFKVRLKRPSLTLEQY